MSGAAILCVDDDPLILLSLTQELKAHFRSRYLYESAASAEEAFQVIAELDSEGTTLILVLSDWLMPGMKGDAFLAKVRAEHPHVRTIMITGHASDETLAEVKRDHLTDRILIKPWKSETLIQAIEELVEEV
jgi:DNA-binding NtrC family response regulator